MNSLLFSMLAGVVLASSQAGPSDEMFDELRNAPSSVIAESLEEDITTSFRESGSPTADLLLERALLAETHADFDLAREFLDRAIAVNPEFSEAWYQRSLMFLSEEAIDQALFDLNEALSHEPRHFRAWLTLGRVFEMLGQNKEVLEAYREVLAISPRNESALSQVRRLAPLVDGRAI